MRALMRNDPRVSTEKLGIRVQIPAFGLQKVARGWWSFFFFLTSLRDDPS